MDIVKFKHSVQDDMRALYSDAIRSLGGDI